MVPVHGASNPEGMITVCDTWYDMILRPLVEGAISCGSYNLQAFPTQRIFNTTSNYYRQYEKYQYCMYGAVYENGMLVLVSH